MAFSILEQLDASTGALDAKGVAKIFGVSAKKIYKMVEEGKMPCVRMGATVKFDPETLAYWVRKQNPAFTAARRSAMREQSAEKTSETRVA